MFLRSIRMTRVCWPSCHGERGGDNWEMPPMASKSNSGHWKFAPHYPPTPSSKTLAVKSKLWSGNHPLLCFTSVRSEPIVNHIWTTLRYEFVQNWPLNLGLLIPTFATKRGWGGMSPIASVSCTGRYLRIFSNRKVICSNVGDQNLILDLWNHYLGFI